MPLSSERRRESGFLPGDEVRLLTDAQSSLSGKVYPSGTLGSFARGFLISCEVWVGRNELDLVAVDGEEIEHA